MATLKDWITLGRPHTASLTIPGTLLGALVTGVTDPILLLHVGLWALLFHWTGFLHNAVQDLPYDQKDPAKQHFPLVSGAISVEEARRAGRLGVVWLLLYGTLLSVHVNGAALSGALIASVGFLVAAVFNGHAYNWYCKQTRFAPLFICNSFASLPAFAYFAMGGSLFDPIIWYVFAFGWTLMLHQIAFSGYQKDLDDDPVNLLRDLGCSARKQDGTEDLYYYHHPLRARVYGWVTRSLAPLFAVWWMLTHGSLNMGAFLLLFVILFVHSQQELDGMWARSGKLRWMSYSEIATYFLLIASLEAALGLWTWALLALPLVWFFGMNQLLWGDWRAPKV